MRHSVAEERGHEACTCHVCIGEICAVGFMQIVVTFHEWGVEAGGHDGREEGGWCGEGSGGRAIWTGEEGCREVAGESVSA